MPQRVNDAGMRDRDQVVALGRGRMLKARRLAVRCRWIDQKLARLFADKSRVAGDHRQDGVGELAIENVVLHDDGRTLLAAAINEREVSNDNVAAPDHFW